jgi:hypothetical protein
VPGPQVLAFSFLFHSLVTTSHDPVILPQEVTQDSSTGKMTEASTGQPRTVQLVHIARDPLYETEKPYAADFSVPKGSNHVFDVKSVVIKDVRSSENNFTLDKNGFCLLESPTSVTFESLGSKGSDSSILSYYQEMESLVLKRFPEFSKVVVLEHQVPIPKKVNARFSSSGY